MKNHLMKGFLVSSLILIVFLLGCIGGSQNSANNSLTGTWSNQQMGITFSLDGKNFTWSDPDGTTSGTYAATGNQLTTNANGTAISYEYLIEGNQLGIKDQSGNGILFTKTSDTPTIASSGQGFTAPTGTSGIAGTAGTGTTGSSGGTQTGSGTSGTTSAPCNALTDCLWLESNGTMAYAFYNGQFILQIQNNKVQGTYTINGNSLVLNDGQNNYNYTFTINSNGRDMTLIDVPTNTPVYFKGVTAAEAQQMASQGSQ